METVVLLLVFFAAGIIGYLFMKKVDCFTEENGNLNHNGVDSADNVIKVVCENPNMLSGIILKTDNMEKELKSLCFYTGSREDIEKSLEKEDYDILLLTEEPNAPVYESYESKKGYYVPSSLTDQNIGFTINPVEGKQREMYILWKEEPLTETKRKLISCLTSNS